MANDKNLIPPKKGEIRNPKGKPKGTRNRSTVFKEILKTKIKASEAKKLNLSSEYPTKDITIEELIALALIKEAQRGNVAAAKEVFDSAYGKLKETFEHGGLDGSPIDMNIVVDWSGKTNESESTT